MKQALGYLRVSTEDQAQEGVSLEAQRAKIESWAEVNGFELIGIEVDAGISGKKADNRPGLQRVLNVACEHGAALVVYSLSRLARSTRDALEISERLDKAGADLVSLSERIDTTSAAGKMVFRMLAVLAEFERDLVSERTRMALAHLRSQGRKLGGDVPFGYQVDDEGYLHEDPIEQRVIVLIKELKSKGLSQRKIAGELEARGIKSKRGGKKWSHQTVGNILKRVA